MFEIRNIIKYFEYVTEAEMNLKVNLVHVYKKKYNNKNIKFGNTCHVLAGVFCFFCVT